MMLHPNNAPTRIEDGRVVCEPRRPHVCIVGFGQTALAVRQLQDDPSYEIWGLNGGYRIPAMYDDQRRLRVDRWFELHPMSVQPDDDLAWLTGGCPVPVYLLEADARVPNGVVFPREATPVHSMQAACTFTYQIQLALQEGFETIALCGLDFTSPREQLMERANVLFWLGVAYARGVRVVTPDGSTLLEHPHRYGYDYHEESAWCHERVLALFRSWSP